MTILNTKRLSLRPWAINDAESLFRYASDNRIGPIAGWPVHQSVKESENIIRNVFMREHLFAVTRHDDNNQAIGCVGLLMSHESNFPIGENDAEVGYWLGVPFWGQGLIPEALLALMEYAFTQLQLDNLWCGYFVENQKSHRVQEKCGFLYHHNIERQYIELLDEYRSEIVSKITKTQWEARY